MASERKIRRAAVAGLFYPADARALRSDVGRYLASIDAPAPAGRVRLVVSPHAGYPYSGRVAAHGFRAVSSETIRTIVLIGPSHVERFAFSSVYDGEGYETPLGVVGVDHDFVDLLCGRTESVVRSDRGHVQEHLGRGEHSLEVQLPFVQAAFENARVVPVVMGDQSWERCRSLGESIADALDDDVLIVASTDLSHFYDAARAAKLDDAFCAALSTTRPADVHDAVVSGRCEACGAGPVVSSLVALEAIADKQYHELCRSDSGEVTGDRSSVVGYLSAAVATPDRSQ